MASDPKIVQYVEELDLLIIRDGEKLYHIDGNAIAGMFKAYMEGYGIDYDICEGCECKREDNTEAPACESCQNQNTCKDAPIPPRYYCVGYKPEAGSMRLIDADALKKKKKHSHKEFFENVVSVYDIDNAPTVEAVPLEDYRSMEQTVHKLTQAIAEAEPKHGRWKQVEVVHDRKDAKIQDWQQAQCSVCGRWHTTPFMYYLKLDNYCPNCGANMREVEE